jgi:hypothetical protein
MTFDIPLFLPLINHNFSTSVQLYGGTRSVKEISSDWAYTNIFVIEKKYERSHYYFAVP